MPKLNLNVSVLSLEPFVIGCANEKLKGPTGVYQSTPIPIELLIVLDSFNDSSSTPQRFPISIKLPISTF